MTNKPLNRSMAANLRPTRARLFLLHGGACPGDTSLRKCRLQPAWAWGLARQQMEPLTPKELRQSRSASPVVVGC
jgi:hypothetical protein